MVADGFEEAGWVDERAMRMSKTDHTSKAGMTHGSGCMVCVGSNENGSVVGSLCVVELSGG